MTQKFHTNELHTKLGHPGEDRMRATAKHLQYRIKGMLEVCKDYAIEKQIETATKSGGRAQHESGRNDIHWN